MNVLILGANGAVARLVERQLLDDKAFADEKVTMFLRNKSRVADLLSEQSSTIEGDTLDLNSLRDAIEDQDIVIDTTGASKSLEVTGNIIQAMEENGVSRVISIVNEEWQSDQQLAKSYQEAGINYTILRVTSFNNAAVSRKVVAQIILNIIDDPDELLNQNINVEQIV